MPTYLVAPVPFKSRVLRAVGETCLPLALEFALRPHSMSLNDFVGQGVIGVFLFFVFEQEDEYCLEIDASGVRKLRHGNVERAVSSSRIRFAKESGRGPYRAFRISEKNFGWLGGGISIPARVREYEQIKAQVLSWLEHPRGEAVSLTP